MQKIIILDIDGPMIPVRAHYLPNQTNPTILFDPVATSLINRLIELSGAKLVISSRRSMVGQDYIRELLTTNNIDPVHLHPDWTTPKKLTSYREHEIGWWLSEHPEVTHYVAIDDARVDSIRISNLVYCNTYEGFSYRNYLEACVFLEVATDSEISDLSYLKRYEIFQLQRPGESKEYLTWRYAEELFPTSSNNT